MQQNGSVTIRCTFCTICSCDTDIRVKNLYLGLRKVLKDCFKRTNNTEHHGQYMFFASAYKIVKNCLNAVSFEKELFLTNNPIPIFLKIHIMISIF